MIIIVLYNVTLKITDENSLAHIHETPPYMKTRKPKGSTEINLKKQEFLK
jgi:hypothetical protein